MLRGKDIVGAMKKVWRFLGEDVWDIELSSLSAVRRQWIKTLRVLHLVIKGFREDECPLHASALTFSSLMSIVPVLALSLALARGFGDEDTAKNRIRGLVSEWTQGFGSRTGSTEVVLAPPDVDVAASTNSVVAVPGDGQAMRAALAEEIDGLVDGAFDKVENISFGALGGVGLVLLVLMAVAALGQVENSFNRVWGVRAGRPVWRKFTDYLSVLFVMPFLIIAATSLPIADLAARFLDRSGTDVVRTLVTSGPWKDLMVFVMTALSFTFLISFMPNTKVKSLPGLVGGVVAALLFIAWLKICASLQVGAARAGRIYGSFAIVPILLAWVHVSWQIVFFGAEVAFAVQNCATYRMEQGARSANVNARLLLALSMVLDAARAMVGARSNLSLADYAGEKRIPVRFLNHIVDVLVSGGLLAELSDRPGNYVLLKSPGIIKVREVMDAVMRAGVGPKELGLGALEPVVETSVQRATRAADEGADGTTIAELLE
ncbi:YihY/virulence factor BrkB family protein [Verrucomicrobiota bacterium]